MKEFLFSPLSSSQKKLSVLFILSMKKVESCLVACVHFLKSPDGVMHTTCIGIQSFPDENNFKISCMTVKLNIMIHAYHLSIFPFLSMSTLPPLFCGNKIV